MLDKKYNSLEKEEKWLNYWKENKIYELNDKARFIKGFGLCNYSIVPHYDINDLMQVNEVKENCYEHNLIGLPNESAIYINGDIVEFINDYYLYNSK